MKFMKNETVAISRLLGNLLSQTLKVLEKKVSIVFYFRPKIRNITISSFDVRVVRFELSLEEEIGS